jgi:hypothetical protein
MRQMAAQNAPLVKITPDWDAVGGDPQPKLTHAFADAQLPSTNISELVKAAPPGRINPALQNALESHAAHAASPSLIDDSKLAALGRLRQQLQQQNPSSSAPAVAPAEVLQHIDLSGGADASKPAGVDLHAGLTPVFPAPQPQKVVLDSNPGHQIQGAFANGNSSEAITLHDQNKLAQDYAKDANPYGSADNHPGFFGKLAHGASVYFGGPARRSWEEQGLVKQLDQRKIDQIMNDYRTAGTGKTQADTAEIAPDAESKRGLEGAQTANLESETAERANPSLQIHDTEDGTILINPKTGDAQHVTLDGQPVGPKLKLTESQPIMGPDGKPHTYMIDDKGNKKVDLGVHYEKPNAPSGPIFVTPEGKVERVAPGGTVEAGSMSPTQVGAGNAADVKQGKADAQATANAAKDYQLMQTLATHPSPTNDLAMVMHYIGATKPDSMGKLRLNQNEISLVMGTRSSMGDLEALAQKVQNGQMLTPEQRNNMLATMRILSQANQGPQNGAAAFRVKLSDAMSLPQNKGKSADEVRQDVQRHGGSVVD